MDSITDFLLDFFQKRNILVKDEWLNATIDYLRGKVRNFDQLPSISRANLVFQQWLNADIAATSFPVFANHQIASHVAKQRLAGPLVCQIQSVRDVGSSCYAQYNSLTGNAKNHEDNTGFDRVFHEKEENHDQKASRVLKMTLFDGESELKAVEFWKNQSISVHLPPGSKLLIVTPCTIRRGVFLLTPHNSQILGGQVGALWDTNLAVDQLARSLNIDNVPSRQNLNSNSNPKPSPAAPTPSANISRYFVKKPAARQRSRSPDVLMDSDDSFDDFSCESSSSNVENRHVSVRTFSLPTTAEKEEFETRKRHSGYVTPPSTSKSVVVQAERASGMLTSRRTDPFDDWLEDMIEEGEEPVSRPKPKAPSPTPPPKKMIKVERQEDSDDDIQIIEPPKPVKQEEPDALESEEELEMTSEERQALEAFKRVKLTSLAESKKRAKRYVGTRRFTTLVMSPTVVLPFRDVDNMWTMRVQLEDDSETTTEALIDNRTLEKLSGYTYEEAMAIRMSSDRERKDEGERRLKEVESHVTRLDLVFEIEWMCGPRPSSIPVVRSIVSLAELLDDMTVT